MIPRNPPLDERLHFITEKRHQMLRDEHARNSGEVATNVINESIFGTVGAVVLDRHGNLSAGTSTRGRTNKRYGRVSDESLEQAAQALIVDKLLPAGGTGGVIALDPGGNVVFVTTTANLKRGVMSSQIPARVAVYSDENVE